MLTEALAALAAAGGTAVVSAAATDSWNTTSRAFSKLFAHSRNMDRDAINAELERTSTTLTSAPTDRAFETQRAENSTYWTGKLEELLLERPEAADELETFVQEYTSGADDPLDSTSPPAITQRVSKNSNSVVIQAGRDIHSKRAR